MKADQNVVSCKYWFPALEMFMEHFSASLILIWSKSFVYSVANFDTSEDRAAMAGSASGTRSGVRPPRFFTR